MLAATRSSDQSSVVSTMSELAPVLIALPTLALPGVGLITAPAVAIVTKVMLDALECIGNLGTILDKSETNKNSLYTVSVTDIAKELLGDAFPSAVDAVDRTGIVDGIVGSVRLVKNLLELWWGSSKGEKLIEEYMAINPQIMSQESNLDYGEEIQICFQDGLGNAIISE